MALLTWSHRALPEMNTVHTVADSTGYVYTNGGIRCQCGYSGFVGTLANVISITWRNLFQTSAYSCNWLATKIEAEADRPEVSHEQCGVT